MCPQASWRLTRVEVLAGFRLRVRFNDGIEGIVELVELLNSASTGTFAVLRDESLFRQAQIELGAVTWPGERIWRRMRCTKRSRAGNVDCEVRSAAA